MKNKYVFCGFWAGKKTVGVIRYMYEVMLELDRRMSAHKVPFTAEILVPKDADWNSPFSSIRTVRRGYIGKDGSISGKILSRLWKEFIFPMYVIFHGGRGVDLALALPVNGVSVYAIHDCIRENCYADTAKTSKYQRRYVKKIERIAADKSNHIVTVSEFSKNDIMSLYKVPAERISVIGNGWEHMTRTQADEGVFKRFGLEGKEYFLSLGMMDQHKNINWILRAARQNPRYTFVVVGRKIDGNVFDKSLVSDNVLFTGYLSDEEIKALMQKCRAFIQPSFYEGFGIPPLEAMASGARAIVSDATALPEVYGDSVVYLDPNSEICDPDALLAQDAPDTCKVLEKHSWKDSGEKFENMLTGLLEKRP